MSGRTFWGLLAAMLAGINITACWFIGPPARNVHAAFALWAFAAMVRLLFGPREWYPIRGQCVRCGCRKFGGSEIRRWCAECGAGQELR